MGTISLKILKEEQYEVVIAMLEALEKKQIISLMMPEENSMAIPGEPVSDKELLEDIDAAEKTDLVSGEEAKELFNLIKKRVEE